MNMFSLVHLSKELLIKLHSDVIRAMWLSLNVVDYIKLEVVQIYEKFHKDIWLVSVRVRNQSWSE